MSVEGTVIFILSCLVVALVLILATRYYSLSRNQDQHSDVLFHIDEDHTVPTQHPTILMADESGAARPKLNGDLAGRVDELRELLERQLLEQAERIRKLESRLSYQKGALTKVRNEMRRQTPVSPPHKPDAARPKSRGKAAGAGES